MTTTLQVLAWKDIAMSEGLCQLLRNRHPDAIRITERVRCPRAVSQTAPGRFRASVSQHYRLGREVLAGLG